MKPLQMNMAKMKKVAGDKKTSTFKHDDGHMIVVLHSALPATMRKEIEKLPLAEGGDVLPKYMHPPKDPKMVAVPRLAMADGGTAKATGSPGAQPVQDASEYDQTLSNGWKNIKKAFMAEGGEAQGQPCMNPNCKSYGHVHPNCKCHGGYAKGGEVQTVCTAKGFHHPSCEMYAEGGELEAPNTNPNVPQSARDDFKANTEDKRADEKERYGQPLTDVKEMKMYADPTEPVAADDSAPVMAAPPAAEATTLAQPPPQQVEPATALANTPVPNTVQPAQSASNLQNPNGTTNTPQASDLQQHAIREQQAVDEAKGRSAATIEDSMAKQRAVIAEQDQNRYNELKGHTDDFKNYLTQNPIDANHYVESMSTGRKVGTAIGLFLGGLGQINGGSNPALDYLNRQIDRDVEAQKARADQQKTIYGAYRELYGDGNLASNLTKVSLNDVYTHKVQEAAAQLGTPQAKAAADAFSAQKANDNQQLLLNSTQDAAVPRAGGVHLNGSSSSAQPGKKSVGPEVQGLLDKNKTDSKANVGGGHILNPGANDRFANIVRLDPRAKEMLPQIEEQKAKAELADKALDTIDDAFPDLMKHSGNQGSYYEGAQGYFHRKAQDLGGIPVVGPAIEGLGEALTDTQNNRLYDAAHEKMAGAIRGALQGNVSDTLLDRIVKKTAPEVGDTPETLRQKVKTAKEFIRAHTRTDLLKTFKLSK